MELMATPPRSPSNSKNPPEVTSKRNRQSIRLKSLTTISLDNPRLVVNINPTAGRGSGPHKEKFHSYLGVVAREKIPIVHSNWNVVLDDLKKLIWEDILFILPFVFKPPTRKNHNLGTNMSLHSSSSVNGEGSTPKDPLYKILDELRSLKLWKKKQERKEKGKKRVEEIIQDEREKIREEERRKIMKEMKREKHASFSSHDSCKSLSEELSDYYRGRHSSHTKHHSQRRENERKPQEANINLPYFHGKDNVEAYLDWEISVEQKLKRKFTLKSYDSHSYPKKDQGLGSLGASPSKPNDDKGKKIEKQPPKASMQEKTSSIKCFKCLGRGHITSQCPTKKTMIMKSQDIYSSQYEATTSPSSSESEEAKREESSEEIYPQEEGKPLMVKEECKEVSVSSKRLSKKERHFEIKTNIKEISLLRQPPHFLLCKKTLVSIATPLGLEFIPLVKELLDEGLVPKSLNPCALLVPKIGIIRHQIPKIGGRQKRGFCSYVPSFGEEIKPT
ncbi:hypothetical protein HKD37_08G023047 [Glycine soja]